MFWRVFTRKLIADREKLQLVFSKTKKSLSIVLHPNLQSFEIKATLSQENLYCTSSALQ